MTSPSLVLQDLAAVLGVAAVTTVVFQRTRQPVILGYVLAGMIVGPHIPIPLVADVGRVHTLSELGVILLMFSLGLEFSVPRLLSLGPRVAVTALLEVSTVGWLGYVAAQLAGFGPTESVFAGAMVSISSTMIIARTFAEQGVDRKLKELVYGILIFEDLLAILMLAALAAVSSGAGLTGTALAATTARLLGFLAGVLVVGYLVVPRAIRIVARLRRSETLAVASIGLCFVMSWLAERAGYSVALGAFLAGSLVAESGEGGLVEHLIKPVRDMFAAIFFVSVGMLIDPAAVLHHGGAIALFCVTVVTGKCVAVGFGSFLTGHGVRTAVQSGMSLSQIGELSFIIAAASAGTAAGHDAPLYPIAVGVSVVTAFGTPWMVRWSGGAAAWVDRKLPHPLQTFVTLYGSWMERLGARRRQTPWAPVRRLAMLMLADVACLASLVIAGAVNRDRLRGLLGALLPSGMAADGPAGHVLVVLLAAVLAAPFAVGLVRCARSLGATLTSMALPPTAEGKLDLAAAPRRALLVTLQLGTLLVAGLPLLAVTQPFLPVLPTAAALAATLAVLGVTFWRSATNLEGHVEAGAQALLQLLRRQAAVPSGDAAALVQVEQVLPGIGRLDSVPVTAQDAALGKTLIDLDLRGLTGASAIALRRPDGTVVVPTGREVLADGDVLTLAGSQEALAQAAVVLRAGRLLSDSER